MFLATISQMLYFAYGSNMLRARLQARVPQAECLGVATLPEYALACDKRSVDGSGKFTIVEDKTASLPGVLYQLDLAGRAVLDEFEGPGYLPVQRYIERGRHSLYAWVYQAQPDWRDASLLPYDWYLAFAVAGAKEQNLPASHQQLLQNWPSQSDSQTDRAALNRSILAGANPALDQQQQWPC